MSSSFSHIDTVFLPVRDLDRSAEWYQQVLEWALVWRNEHVAAFKGSSQTHFTLLRHQSSDEGAFAAHKTPAFNLFSDRIDDARRSLVEKGVSVGPIMNHGGGIIEFQFHDPDGNCLSVVKC